MAVVRIDGEGRLTIPSEALRALGVEGETDLTLEVDAEQEILLLRPIDHDDDSWLYDDPDVRASIDRGLADIKAGRVHRATEADLRALAPCDP
ncbi:MAG: AbrB/MazE/SpoVT family DNA-binding domain-containing protein [Dehalococcoidia bacterium]